MADFRTSVLKTLQHEGGFTDNVSDSGGATNMGIEQRDMPDIDIRNLTQDQAVNYYASHYWKALYSQISSQSVADKLFDLGVLFGVGTAVEQLQTLLKITADGIFGQDTLTAVNAADPASLLSGYKTLFVARALAIGAAKLQDRIFVAGWVARINS